MDLGSSYARLLVLDTVDDPPAVIADERRFIGWGADLVCSGCLSDEMVDRAGEALAGLVEAAAAAGCGRPVIVATNALRAAANGPEAAARLALLVEPLPLFVVDQEREAALGFRGAASVLNDGFSAALVDPGGTSTEFSWGTGGEASGWFGLPWGTHRVRELLGRGGPSRARRLRADLAGRFGQRLAAAPGGVLSALSKHGRGGTMLATGGTAVSVAAVARLLRGEGRGDPTWVGRETLDLAARRLAARYAAGLAGRLPLDPGRIALLPAGIVLFRALLDAAGAAGALVTARDLRWGAILGGVDGPGRARVAGRGGQA
ncbi:MAG: hypothetical protein JW876_03170 [Candidatus Krumholzibacteriota bacterium]|nr:hypothetical protein [Candidatus Krumholzibacteriota bacterium]